MSSTSGPSAGSFSVVRNGIRAAFTMPPFVATHAWRSRRVERRHVDVGEQGFSEPAPSHEPHPLLQPRESGVGPSMMRTYEIGIADPTLTSPQLIDGLRKDPNHYNSSLLSGFVVDDEAARNLTVGDELVVELPGPWNGPVVVQAADEHSILLATLDGHMEAGHTRFDTTPLDDGQTGYRFRIRSWARAGDAGFAALHLGLPVGRELQTAMWVAMCDRALRISGGRQLGPITVTTEQCSDS